MTAAGTIRWKWQEDGACTMFHHIRPAVQNRLNQLLDIFGTVLVVGICIDELRPSRLFNSIWGYVKKSMLTILRAYMMYKPLKTFSYLAVSPILTGLCQGTITRPFSAVFIFLWLLPEAPPLLRLSNGMS